MLYIKYVTTTSLQCTRVFTVYEFNWLVDNYVNFNGNSATI